MSNTPQKGTPAGSRDVILRAPDSLRPFRRLTFALLSGVALALPLTASASIVTLNPTDVNRLIGSPTSSDNHYTDLFSTYMGYPGGQPAPQRTLVITSKVTLYEAIKASLGAASSYTINSATLTVGSNQDPYTSSGSKRAYLVLKEYDPDTVTWKTFNSGGVQGTDYSSTVSATGVVSGNVTTWTFSKDLLQNWLDGTTTNYGLFFPDAGASDGTEYTDTANVVWTLDVTAVVPEPAASALLGLALGVIGCSRKRTNRKA